METVEMAMKPGDVLRTVAAARGCAPFHQQAERLHARLREPRA